MIKLLITLSSLISFTCFSQVLDTSIFFYFELPDFYLEFNKDSIYFSCIEEPIDGKFTLENSSIIKGEGVFYYPSRTYGNKNFKVKFKNKNITDFKLLTSTTFLYTAEESETEGIFFSENPKISSEWSKANPSKVWEVNKTYFNHEPLNKRVFTKKDSTYLNEYLGILKTYYAKEKQIKDLYLKPFNFQMKFTYKIDGESKSITIVDFYIYGEC